MTLLCAVDFETTGTNTAKCDVIEVGAALWDVELKTYIETYSTLVRPEPFTELSKEIVRLTGIRSDSLLRFGVPTAEAIEGVTRLALKAQYVAAHNGATFDRVIYERLSMSTFGPLGRPWIDTQTDIPYADDMTERKLLSALAQHGYANPFPHRALLDALSCCKLISLYPFDAILERAASPRLLVIAEVPFEDKDSAKAFRFDWQDIKGYPKHLHKTWAKVVKKCDLEALRAEIAIPGELSDGRPRVQFKTRVAEVLDQEAKAA